MAVGATLLALVPLVQLAAGQITFHSDAWLCAMYLVGFAVAVQIGAVARASDRSLSYGLFCVFVAGGLVSTAIGLVQWLQLGSLAFVERLGSLERVSANMRQPNQLASLLAVGVLGVLWFYEERKIRGSIATVALALLGLCLVMTQSRTGWAFVVCIGGAWWFFKSRLHLRSSTLAIAVGVGFFFLAVALFGQANHWLGLSESVSLGERLRPGRRGAIWM